MKTFIRPLQPTEVEFDVHPREETQDLADAFDDDATRNHCLEELRRGNKWGWCEITVRARWCGFSGEAHLGGCSYASEEDFIGNAGYYEDMCTEAFNLLNDSVEQAARSLEPLVTRESIDEWIVSKVQEG